MYFLVNIETICTFFKLHFINELFELESNPVEAAFRSRSYRFVDVEHLYIQSMMWILHYFEIGTSELPVLRWVRKTRTRCCDWLKMIRHQKTPFKESRRA